MSDSLQHLTLRDKIKDVEKLSRELSDHLERGFIPKTHNLRRLARHGTEPDQRDNISDISVREAVANVLASDAYARDLYQKTREYLRSIESDIERMFSS